MHHGVTFHFGSVKMCSPAIYETCFSYDKDIWIAASLQLIIICALHNCAISIGSYTPINKFYRFVMFSLPINAVILLMNCLVLMLYHYMHFLSLSWYFLN